MEAFADRLFEFMEANGLSQNKFEEICGLTHSNLRDKKQGPTAAYMKKILTQFPELSSDWLITGRGQMIKRGENCHNSPNEIRKIPIIPMEAFAGPGRFTYNDIATEDYYSGPEFKNSDFLIRIKGDSMTPRFKSGDIVACKIIKDNLFFQWGRVYVIYTLSQGVMMKRVRPGEKEGFITLVSDNTNYPPFQVPVSDIASIALVNGAIISE